MLGVEPRASHRSGKSSVTGLHLQHFIREKEKEGENCLLPLAGDR